MFYIVKLQSDRAKHIFAPVVEIKMIIELMLFRSEPCRPKVICAHQSQDKSADNFPSNINKCLLTNSLKNNTWQM